MVGGSPGSDARRGRADNEKCGNSLAKGRVDVKCAPRCRIFQVVSRRSEFYFSHPPNRTARAFGALAFPLHPNSASATPVFSVRLFRGVASERLKGNIADAGDESQGFRLKAPHFLGFLDYYRKGKQDLCVLPIGQSATLKDSLYNESTMFPFVEFIHIHIPEQAWGKLFYEVAHANTCK